MILVPSERPGFLGEPLYAVNWLNARSPLLYDFYNLLAALRLPRSGGRLLLKARFKKTIHGREEDRRGILLIVRYPSGGNFLGLMADRVFQAISAVRVLAVKDFSLAMYRRADEAAALGRSRTAFSAGKVQAVHCFDSDGPVDGDLDAVGRLIGAQDIFVRFAGELVATVWAEDADGRRRQVPFTTRKLIVLETADAAVLESFLSGKGYLEFMAGLRASYVGIFAPA